jgi:hypothetical protein
VSEIPAEGRSGLMGLELRSKRRGWGVYWCKELGRGGAVRGNCNGERRRWFGLCRGRTQSRPNGEEEGVVRLVALLAHKREGDTGRKKGSRPGSGLRRRGSGRHASEDTVAPAQEDTGAGTAAVGKEGTDAWRGAA